MEDPNGAKVLLLLGLKHIAGKKIIILGTWKLPAEIIPELLACLGAHSKSAPASKSKSSEESGVGIRISKIADQSTLSAMVSLKY